MTTGTVPPPKTKLYGEPGTRMRAYELAEQVALLWGWCGITDDDSDRAKALHRMWREWAETFTASGGDLGPKGNPGLSNARVAELATEQRDHEARMRVEIEKLVEVIP